MGAAGRSAGSAQPGCAAAAPGARSGLSRPLPAVAGRPGRCGGGDSERTALRALGQPDSDRCPRALDARQGPALTWMCPPATPIPAWRASGGPGRRATFQSPDCPVRFSDADAPSESRCCRSTVTSVGRVAGRSLNRAPRPATRAKSATRDPRPRATGPDICGRFRRYRGRVFRRYRRFRREVSEPPEPYGSRAAAARWAASSASLLIDSGKCGSPAQRTSSRLLGRCAHLRGCCGRQASRTHPTGCQDQRKGK